MGGIKRRAIVEDSRAAVGGVAAGSRGRAVLPEGLPGIPPVLGSPGRACRACWACWACCTGCNHRGCSPWASGRTCMDTTTDVENVRTVSQSGLSR